MFNRLREAGLMINVAKSEFPKPDSPSCAMLLDMNKRPHEVQNKGKRRPRLIGGNDTCSGRVEIMFDDTWNTVCDTYWDLQDAAVVCNQLGCGAAISTSGGAYFGEGNGPIWNYIHVCTGNEIRLNDCPIASRGHREDWQLRLVNGQSICEGRVEVYYDGVWGRVTDTQWNLNEAEVVCRQLKCGSAISIYNHLKSGKGRGPTWISNVRCNGSEPFLGNCSFTKTEQSSIGDDVGVVCSDHIQIRLVDGGSDCAGRVELYYNGSWGTACDDSWDLAHAQIVCNQLKCGQALNATVSGWFGPGMGPVWLDCGLNDSVLWECLVEPWSESDCNHKEDAGVICSGTHRAVRLQDGANPCQGRIEVFYNGTWGTVCADSFDMEDAEVVCKQLSCGSAQSVDGDVTFGSGSGPIWLDDVSCRLHDMFLWQCPSSPWGEHNCAHQEDVGVICSELSPRKIRNEGDMKNSKTQLASEKFGYGKTQYPASSFPEPAYEEIEIHNLGTGPDIQSSSSLKLEYYTGSELQEGDDIHLQAVTVQPSNETTSAEIVHKKELISSMLVGPYAPCIGSLLVYSRGQWNSVCSSLWDSADGKIVCKQIGCGSYHTTSTNPITQETGPMLVDKIQCKGTESSLSECALNSSGQQKCETGTTVVIFCKGINELLINIYYFCPHTLLADMGISQEVGWKSLTLSGILSKRLVSQQPTGEPRDQRSLVQTRRRNDRQRLQAIYESPLKGSGKEEQCSLLSDGNLNAKENCPTEIRNRSEQVICSSGTRGHWVKQNVILVDGDSPCAGRVQARNFDAWGIICGRSWDMNDARVLCKYLGCGDAVSASGNSQFGAGNLPVFNFEIGCNGSEEDPWKCELKHLAHKNCSGEVEAAGVICSGKRRPRLVGGNDTCSGRVEIMFDDTWNTVCDTYWDLQDAAVVCNQLGCGAAISTPEGAYFGEGNGPIWNYIHVCTGNEIRLTDCPIASSGDRQCTHRNDASVICSGASIDGNIGGCNYNELIIVLKCNGCTEEALDNCLPLTQH
ncbi:scavenger receptor cysteine-rich domain-containing protein DMBT1-like [Chiloscyllium punctatum]|uniref:scavenger receptor cysteine-rich domain-containing protein DMBT1-like n=1 Tax=Chiloscyllium punctatum TaxID=137246 RepID=UPI003B63CC3B